MSLIAEGKISLKDKISRIFLLNMACLIGDIHAINLLLNDKLCDINAQSKHGDTPLMSAYRGVYNDFTCKGILINIETNPDEKYIETVNRMIENDEIIDDHHDILNAKEGI
jgi:ankyrin repeat protein